MAKGSGITIGGGWVGETVTREGQAAIEFTRDADKASIAIKEKYNDLGEKTLEITTNIKDADSYKDAIDIIGSTSGLIPGYGWLGEAAADIGKRGVDNILKYRERLRQIEEEAINGSPVKDRYGDSKKFTPPRDPISLDLDGDGVESVGLAANIYYDHNADGVLTATGWVKPDDALLVRDLNGDGQIDSGRELFGDNTLLANGKYASNGYTALAALDQNVDGVIDASDAAFTELKLWQDLNQDGISQAGELKTLTEAGVASLNLAATLKNQSLGNGNTLARESTYTRTDGSQGKSGELNLAIDTFNTRFATAIDVPEALKSLPNMAGTGNVRDLRQAVTLSGSLQGVVGQFQNATTRIGQKALLDQLLANWADTSGMAKTLDERAAGQYRIEYMAFGNERRSSHMNTALLTDPFAIGTLNEIYMHRPLNADNPMFDDSYRNLIASWNQKLHILEAFNGQYFFNLPEQKSETPSANVGFTLAASAQQAAYYSAIAMDAANFKPVLAIGFAQQQLDLLDQAYAALKDSVYGALVLQTRLKPYLDQINLVFDESGLHFDASALNQSIQTKLATDPENALGDLLDLDRYAGNILSGTNWDGMSGFDGLIESLPQTPAITALLDEFKVQRLSAGNDSPWLSSENDIVLANAGDDTVYGNNGNDRLYGQAGNDRLFGGEGRDLLSGGTGDDVLYGDNGADTYVFGTGGGHDTILDHEQNGQKLDSVRFLGLNPTDIAVTADLNDNLVFSVKATGDTLSVPHSGNWWSNNGVGQYVFDDGTVWSHDDALRATVAAATESDDVIFGSSAGDTISGLAGNDTLVGGAGNDTVDGGTGNDLLIGSTALNWINDNGTWRIERGLGEQTSANGNDTYLFGRGDGQDTIIDSDWTAGNNDTLRFKEGITPSDISVFRADNDLLLSIRGSTDSVTLRDYFGNWDDGRNATYLIENITFADGTTWQYGDVQDILFAGSDNAETITGSRLDDHLAGQAGNDKLLGDAGNDLLEGGASDDVLLGGAGSDILDGGSADDILRGNSVEWGGSYVYEAGNEADTYRFGRGDGHDTVIDDSWSTGALDRIELKSGITLADIRLQRVNGDLVLTIRDTGDTLTVKNQFADARFRIEELALADGTLLNLDQIEKQVLIGEATDDLLLGYANRDDVLVGAGGNDKLYGNSGDDLLDGGTGDDLMAGGTGSDTYRFGNGSGKDLISEAYGDAASIDVIELAADIVPADVLVRRTLQSDLSIQLKQGDDRLIVQGQLHPWASVGTGIEALRFADGTTWDRATLEALAISATDGNDEIVSGYGDETLEGLAGDDGFQDIGGYDTYRFGIGDGNDTVIDPSGRISFKSGIGPNDVSFSADGNDLVATLNASGETLRIKDWQNNWSRIDAFAFDNGTTLSAQNVAELINIASGAEIIYGSPGNDVLTGTAANSTLYALGGDDELRGGDGDDYLVGDVGNDTLRGDSGRDTLNGGDGNDLLIGGSGRDTLQAGAGNNTYVLEAGTGLDTVYTDQVAVADDTVVFGAGIRPEDITVQLGNRSWSGNIGAIGYLQMVVGIGGNDAFLIQNANWSDLNEGGIRRFRFEDGTELSLADMAARVDGMVGSQYHYQGDASTLVGSEADDYINDYTGDADLIVRARGNDDSVYLSGGDDIISAGTGNDRVDGSGGNDLITGEAGDDQLYGGAGNDTFVFNRGDGHDVVAVGNSAGTDTLSFGVGILPEQITVAFDSQGRLTLYVDAGTAGTISLEGATLESISSNQAGVAKRLQFVAADGNVRIFDFADWVRNQAAALASSSKSVPLAFTGVGFELTGTVAPAGGLEAIAYAQTGDLFAQPTLSNNSPTSGNDVLFGTDISDNIDGNAGNDIILGLDGDDSLNGGVGDDIVYGGYGADSLTGGSGNDQLFGEWGGDTYTVQLGDGEVIIDDDHWVRNLGYGGEMPAMAAFAASEFAYGGDYGGGYGGGYGGDYGGTLIDNVPNVLVFGAGIRPEDLRYSELNGDLLIEFAHSQDRVILRGYRPDRATQTRSVDIFRFADGTEIAADSLEYAGLNETGTDGDDWLYGSDLADRLIGGEGNDQFSGGGGSDRLVGGVGSDTYTVYQNYDRSIVSETTIEEVWQAGDSNQLQIDGNVNPDEAFLEFDGKDLLLQLGDGGDMVRFAGFDPRAPGMQAPVDQVSFWNSGVTLSFDELLSRGIRIIGTPQSDILSGTALDDFFVGLESNDQMSGGAGSDTYLVEPDGGVDTIIDLANATEGNLVIFPDGVTLDDIRLSFDANEGYLIVKSSATGNTVRLSGFDPADPLGARAVERFRFGEGGPEISYEELLSRGFDIIGTAESDQLSGTTLQDRIQGLAGSDLIDATPGGDLLAGGAGNDQYVVNLGDGIVTIDDNALQGEGNVLRFGDGISTDNLRTNLRFEADGLGGYVLLLPYGNEGDVVRLLGFNPDDVENGGHAVEQFEFADGTVVDYATLISWTFVVEGDNTANGLSGTSVGDRLYGYAGDDLLEAGAGNDVLTGGSGDDELDGGAGRDAYVVNLGDGQDVIFDTVESGVGNIVTFGAGIAREDVRFEQDGADLVVQYGALGDSIRITNYAPDGVDAGTVVDTFEFADGSTISLREFLNHVPEVNSAIADQAILEDAPFLLALPADLFIDADGDALIERVSVSGYDQAPAWLKYDPTTRTLYGTPENADVGEFNVTISATDTMGTSAAHTFKVNIANTNDAPEVATQITDRIAVQGQAFAYTLPENAFRDVDKGDQLTLSAELANGDALPSWLSFDAATGIFSGVPTNGDVGSLGLRIVATDLAGASVGQTFNLTVANTNDAPVVNQPLADLSVQEDQSFTFSVPGNTFSDIDQGDTLTLSATLGDGSQLPNWLAFDALTATFSGQPDNGKVGSWSVLVTATDLAGTSVSTGLNIAVENVNDVPTVYSESYSINEDNALSLTSAALLANDLDIDPTNDVLSIEAVGDASHGMVSLSDTGAILFTPDANFNGQAGFSYTVADGRGGLTQGQVLIDVAPVNDAPGTGFRLSDQTIRGGTAFNYALPNGAFTDIDGDQLTYSATLSNGSALPSWLSFDAVSGVFNGSTTNVSGTFSFAVTATDPSGATASQTFSLAVTGGNSVPVANPDSASVKEDCKLLACGNVLTNDRDADAGSQLKVADAGIRKGEFGTLYLMNNGSYSYVLNNTSTAVQALAEGKSAIDRFSYTASDGVDSSIGELSVAVAGANDKPWLQKSLFDRTLAKNSDVSWQIPAGTFKDIDAGDTLTYKATLSNGKALPSWLKFDAATQTFSGHVPANAKDGIDITVTASDGHGSASVASDTFKVDFGKTNCVHGNEGLGNGEDPPPPGYSENQNDGAGSGPGNSGHHGRDQDSHDDAKESKSDKRDDWFDDWGKSKTREGDFAYLDLNHTSLRDRETDTNRGHDSGASNDDFYHRWAEMDKALAKLMADSQQDKGWTSDSHGADMRWLAGLSNSGSAAHAPDTVSLCGSSGTQLNGFRGLQEGVKTLG